MSSLSQPPFSRHDFACSIFQFLIQRQICCCCDLNLLETELPVMASIFSRDLNSDAG